MKNGVSIPLEDLIRLAFTDTPRSHERLGRAALRYSRSITLRRCPDLPDDLHYEIFQQAFVELFRAGPDGIGTHGGVGAFRRAVFAAMRQVRADYAPPGRPTRRKSDEDATRVAAENVGQILDVKGLRQCTVTAGEHAELDLDQVASAPAAAAQQQVDDRLTTEAILATAPVAVATALRLIHLEGEPVDDAAAAVGLTRFALNRRITAFCTPWRLAA